LPEKKNVAFGKVNGSSHAAVPITVGKYDNKKFEGRILAVYLVLRET